MPAATGARSDGRRIAGARRTDAAPTSMAGSRYTAAAAAESSPRGIAREKMAATPPIRNRKRAPRESASAVRWPLAGTSRSPSGTMASCPKRSSTVTRSSAAVSTYAATTAITSQTTRPASAWRPIARTRRRTVLIGAQHDIRYRKRMKRVERQTVIGAPPAEVFAYLSDLDKISEWQAGITDARQTSEGGMRVGATALVTRELMGQQMQAPLLVTEYEPPQRIAIDSEVSGVKVHATLDLAPTADGEDTDLSFAIEIRGSML